MGTDASGDLSPAGKARVFESLNATQGPVQKTTRKSAAAVWDGVTPQVEVEDFPS
jgi:hypothetical protein